MSEVAMCHGEDCDLAPNCFRFLAQPNKDQSYFVKQPNSDVDNCQFFWNVSEINDNKPPLNRIYGWYDGGLQ